VMMGLLYFRYLNLYSDVSNIRLDGSWAYLYV
jgi:hypothetical protein